MNNTEMTNIEMYSSAVQAIKTAILQGQYEATPEWYDGIYNCLKEIGIKII